jgi:hypothetical protein
MATTPWIDRRRTSVRLMVLSVTIVTVFLALAVSFWYLQVVKHATFLEMAENNHMRRLSLRAPRGVLFDRDLRVLVENRDAYTISILREHSLDLDQTILRLAAATGEDKNRIRETVDRHRGEPSYRPIVVIDDATLAQVAAVLARRLNFELPGVVVERAIRPPGWGRTCSATSARWARRKWPPKDSAPDPWWASPDWRRRTTSSSWAPTANGESWSTASAARSPRSTKWPPPRAGGSS